MDVIKLNTFKKIIQYLRFKNYDLNQKIQCHVEDLIWFTWNPFEKKVLIFPWMKHWIMKELTINKFWMKSLTSLMEKLMSCLRIVLKFLTIK